MRVLVLLALFLCVGANGAFAQSEPLQPGDTLQISVLQDPKLDRQVVVAPDGMIAFPLAGHIKAAGITAQALENLLRARLQKNYTEQLERHGFARRGQSDRSSRLKAARLYFRRGAQAGALSAQAAHHDRAGHFAGRRLESLCGQPADSGSSQDRWDRQRSGV